MKRKVIRVGDRVKIVESKFIKRVGYPLIWTDLIDEVAKDPRTLKAWAIITAPQNLPQGSIDVPPQINGEALETAFLPKLSDIVKEPEIPIEFIRAVARERVREMNFGGNERQIIYLKTRTDMAGLLWSSGKDECADYTGQIFEVFSKKIAKTGTRFPSTHGHDSYNGEYWYEQGGLDNCKTHVLLETSAGWIENIHVELYKRAPGSTDSRPAKKR